MQITLAKSQLLPDQPWSHAPVHFPPPAGPGIGYPCLHVGPCRIADNLAATAQSVTARKKKPSSQKILEDPGKEAFTKLFKAGKTLSHVV